MKNSIVENSTVSDRYLVTRDRFEVAISSEIGFPPDSHELRIEPNGRRVVWFHIPSNNLIRRRLEQYHQGILVGNIKSFLRHFRKTINGIEKILDGYNGSTLQLFRDNPNRPFELLTNEISMNDNGSS